MLSARLSPPRRGAGAMHGAGAAQHLDGAHGEQPRVARPDADAVDVAASSSSPRPMRRRPQSARAGHPYGVERVEAEQGAGGHAARHADLAAGEAGPGRPAQRRRGRRRRLQTGGVAHDPAAGAQQRRQRPRGSRPACRRCRRRGRGRTTPAPRSRPAVTPPGPRRRAPSRWRGRTRATFSTDQLERARVALQRDHLARPGTAAPPPPLRLPVPAPTSRTRSPGRRRGDRHGQGAHLALGHRDVAAREQLVGESGGTAPRTGAPGVPPSCRLLSVDEDHRQAAELAGRR